MNLNCIFQYTVMDWLKSLKIGDTILYHDEMLTVNKELYFMMGSWKVRVNRRHYKNSKYLQFRDGLIYFAFTQNDERPLYYSEATVIPSAMNDFVGGYKL